MGDKINCLNHLFIEFPRKFVGWAISDCVLIYHNHATIMTEVVMGDIQHTDTPVSDKANLLSRHVRILATSCPKLRDPENFFLYDDYSKYI